MKNVKGLNKKKNRHSFIETDNSMVTTRGKEGLGQWKRVKGIDGDGKRGLWMVNTEYNI